MKEMKMDNSSNSTVNNIFNLDAGSSVSLKFVIQGSQTPDAQRLTQLEKASIAAAIEATAQMVRRASRANVDIEAQLEAIAARLHLL